MPDEPNTETKSTISGGLQFGPVFQGRDFDVTIRPAMAAPAALAQLPAPVSGFSGRDNELAVIAELLAPSTTIGAVVLSAVAGLAGVGKTALAVQAGHAAHEQGWFNGGVLFIDLHGYDESPVKPGQALGELLRALGVAGEHIPDGLEARASLFRSILSEIHEPLLLIADNASSEAQVRPLLPGLGPHRVVVTSRHTLADLRARLIDVTVLGEEAAVELLEVALCAGRPDDSRIRSEPEAATRLARICGGLPLALQIIASLLKGDPSRGIGELAEELSAERVRLQRLQYDDGSGAAAPSVAAAFELSYRRLDEAAARMFRNLALNPGPDLSTNAASILVDQPVSQARVILARLAIAHLIDAAPGLPGRWRFHDLLRLYAGRLSDADEDIDSRENTRSRLLGYYLKVATAADRHLKAAPGSDLPEDFPDQSEALAWLDVERVNLLATVTVAAETGRDAIALRLPQVTDEYLGWRRRFDDLLTVTSISLRTARHLGDRESEGKASHSLSLTLREIRRFDEAIAASQDAIAIFRETGDRYHEGRALNSLSMSLLETRQFEEAIAVCRDAVAILQEAAYQHAQGQALNTLSAILYEIRQFQDAITTGQDAAVIFRNIGDRFGEGVALNSLSLSLFEVRRFEEGITVAQDAAAIFRETGDQHGEGMALHNLSMSLYGVRRFEEGITVAQDAAAIFRETGDQHGEGMALHNLSASLFEVRRFEEGITVAQDAAAIFRETGDRRNEGMALNNLSASLYGVRRFEEGITVAQDAAAIFRETGDRHSEGVALNSLSVSLFEVRRFEEGITVAQDAAAIFRETGDRRNEGMALHNLSMSLQGVRRFEEGITMAQDASAIFRETGDRHSEGVALNNFGLALRRVGRVEEAITAQQDATAIYQEPDNLHRESPALAHAEQTQSVRYLDAT